MKPRTVIKQADTFSFLPRGKYRGEPNEDILKGFVLTVWFASMGYGLSAKIMGKNFAKYALYGGTLALCTETLAVLYTRYTERQEIKSNHPNMLGKR